MSSQEYISNRADKSTSKKVRVLGICLGASTISMAHIEYESEEGGLIKRAQNPPRVISSRVYPHDGGPRQTLIKAVRTAGPEKFDKIAVTGRKFRRFVNLTSISEPEAVENAYRFARPEGVDCPAIISAGGETFMVYILNRSGLISNVLTGNKCASGTGEFFLQQLRRLDVTLDEAAQWAATEDPYQVSGRCSVFCKSDCTHATNKGVPKRKVTAGLCKMMSDKILELLKKVERRNVMLTGGTSQNRMMVEYLKKSVPGMIIPDIATCFEAAGAALWAIDNDTAPFPGIDDLFKSKTHSFDKLPPLKDFEHMVEFKRMDMRAVRPGDICIIGLDVGSTTTKAVLMDYEDHSILADVYLRTNGDPVGASRKCYQKLLDQIRQETDPGGVTVIGLGVCGSGRQIAGLHALTDGVINEIIAHAEAAVFFDSKVDTIFEIGGQDAKYTYVTNSVSSDYAMNEACSAGTGSFLEESAFETLGIQMTDIAEVALKGNAPPNFNDQCAAFIASDIKNSIHEGVKREDIVAGLVYSICMNYCNRVKGNRQVGEKVFMQGGVCYNRAVPLAMASLLGKPIIVPPEPGLMGAFGVALEVKKRIESGLIPKKRFDLEVLIERDVVYGKSFICRGGKEKCDRKCEITMIHLDGKKYPFGGACNRYYNLRKKVQYDLRNLDLVSLRQSLIFEKYAGKLRRGTKPRGRVGINRSFLVNTYYPLYSNFFSELGFETVLPDHVSRKGIDDRNAAFCYPGELSHGFFYSLLVMDNPPDYIFLPHFKAVPVQQEGLNVSQVCPLVQGEPYYLKSTFKHQIKRLQSKGVTIIQPLIDLTGGLDKAEKPLLDTALEMGVSRDAAKKAFKKALDMQNLCIEEMKKIGRRFLEDMEKNPEKSAVILFARPYNGFAKEAHMGIPNKFASRGVPIVPFDFLPFESEQSKRHMYWGMGQILLKAARFVKNRPQLFGTFITNFSCGPDSFIVGYFRNIMERKPSLTLELDSHTADAGLETRIEAFLDIVAAYRRLMENSPPTVRKNDFTPARTFIEKGVPKVLTSKGEILKLNDPRVTFLLPSMGKISTEALAAVFQGYGVRAVAHDPANEEILKIGRANTSCKECLPLILTTGMLLHYIGNGRGKDEVLVYFMTTASGPCRFGQYSVFMEDLIKKRQIPDTALFSLTSENSYSGFDAKFHKVAWSAVVIADVMEDIRSMLLANARDRDRAIEAFDSEWRKILKALGNADISGIERAVDAAAVHFSGIPMKRPPEEVPVISLIGEIFVRRDSLSRQYLTERLADRGFAATCAPVSEWIYYTDYLIGAKLSDVPMTFLDKFKLFLRRRYMNRCEKSLKTLFGKTGMVHSDMVSVQSIIDNASPHISPNLTGEAVLTIGSALTEIATHSCGVIAIGPFGCMPNRLSESVLNEIMTGPQKRMTDPENKELELILEGTGDLPFFAVESDGSPFPQVIDAKLEAFCLHAERLHERMIGRRRQN